MSMRLLQDAPQGSAAWHAARAQRFCASEAAAAMNVSKYTTRASLLKQKFTGLTEEVSPAKQRLFDAGHASEKATMGIAQDIAGVEFYPAVGIADIDGLPLLASFDGIDMLEVVLWENKMRNAALVGQVCDLDLEPHYWAQLEHQLLVSGAEKVLFTTSDGTLEGTDYLWYESVPERRAQVIAAWKQFAIDLAAYVPVDEPAPAPMGATRERLPALIFEAKGEITASNLDEYKVHALTVVGDIPVKPETDQQYADAKEDAQFCRDIESAMEHAETAILGRMSSVDEAIKVVKHIREVARRKAIDLENAVTAEEKRRKQAMVVNAKEALRSHVDALDVRIGHAYMPASARVADFDGAIKNKRSVPSMQAAVDGTLANAKIAADAIAGRIDTNLKYLATEAGDYTALFPDIATVAQKDPQDFVALVQFRVADFKAKEAIRTAAAAELAAAKQNTEGAELSPAAQVLNETEGAQRFASTHRTSGRAPVAVRQAAVVESQDDISRFLASRRWDKGQEQFARAVLVEFEKFRADQRQPATA